jgi:4-amino-4-deoxy-L-arabinose transferase-like glycosyltransferase
MRLHQVAEKWGVALLLVASLLLRLQNLGHDALTYWDESFHALAARNLLKHPLKPTLVDVPYLPYDFRSWGDNHVWLHKPILTLWQIALAYAALGVNTFALRLPSALLSAGAVLLTYLIGREVLDRRAAFLAASIQSLNPAIMSLVHGYLYSDHVDVALLFWTELGVYYVVRAMRTGRRRHAVLAGVAQGLAYLSKSYLAAIVTGVAVAAWVLPRVRLGRPEDARVRPAHLGVLLGATLLTVAPWTVYSMLRYPAEFAHEHAYVWKHLNTNIEEWGAPWDRLVFDYSIHLYGVFYTPALVAALALMPTACRQRHTGLWTVYAWGLGVLVPHVLSTTKTPSATVFGMPPFFLLLGMLVSEAWRGDRWALGAWAGSMAMSLAQPAAIGGWGRGYPSPDGFGAVMRQSLWVVWHVVGALAIGVLALAASRFGRKRAPVAARTVKAMARWAAVAFATAGLCLLAVRTGQEAWKVVQRNQNEPTFSEIAAYARTVLPENAVLLFDFERAKENWGDHQLTMFRADRTCYRFEGAAWQDMGRTVLSRGGVPYVVSHRRMELPPLFRSEKDDRTIYAWRDPDAVAR